MQPVQFVLSCDSLQCIAVMKRAYYTVKLREKRILCMYIMQHVKPVVYLHMPSGKSVKFLYITFYCSERTQRTEMPRS